MAIDFVSPSMRASGLAVSISPLGLVELSDEEFEVHGQRMNRYAINWAHYLGYHWGYARESGEPQLTFNYVRALSDFITNFTFGKGLQFQSAAPFQHIVPALLDRIWTVDNHKEKLLWEIGQTGGIGGDVFVKVAYEPAWEDRSGMVRPGRVRILPLHPATCFPRWAPHDKERLEQFKLKYKFWRTNEEGTRQIYTYTEILTDDWIEEYINDELIDRRPNPLGVIPVTHISNLSVSGSPWGMSDIETIVPLNRTYNELYSDVVDIINYHAAPWTVVIGAKMANLEKSAKRLLSLPKDAEIKNLEGGAQGLSQIIEAMTLLKTAMHEMTGVPETALGQMQPISNTSGVALAVQYQPMMQRYNLKKIQYEVGLRQICEHALRTLFLYEPEAIYYNPDTSGLIEDDQSPYLDPADPLVYQIDVDWPPPLPVDILIKLNELNVKIALGLESREGALRELGEPFPDEKLEELAQEQIEDARRDAVTRFLISMIDAQIMAMTGVVPETREPLDEGGAGGGGSSDTPGGDAALRAGTGRGDESKASSQSLLNTIQRAPVTQLPGAEDLNHLAGQAASIYNEMVQQAFGAKQRRTPGNKEE